MERKLRRIFKNIVQFLLLLLGFTCVAVIRVWRFCFGRAMPKPGKMHLFVLGESDSMSQPLRYVLYLPEWPTRGGVVGAKLTVQSGGEVVASQDLPVGSERSEVMVGVHGQSFSAELRHYDEAGNVSEPTVTEFSLVDGFAPDAPGAMRLEVLGEAEDNAPEPAPEPSPEPAPPEPEPAPEPSGPQGLTF